MGVKILKFEIKTSLCVYDHVCLIHIRCILIRVHTKSYEIKYFCLKRTW